MRSPQGAVVNILKIFQAVSRVCCEAQVPISLGCQALYRIAMRLLLGPRGLVVVVLQQDIYVYSSYITRNGSLWCPHTTQHTYDEGPLRAGRNKFTVNCFVNRGSYEYSDTSFSSSFLPFFLSHHSFFAYAPSITILPRRSPSATLFIVSACAADYMYTTRARDAMKKIIFIASPLP